MRKRAGSGVSWASARKLVLSFPGISEGTSYGQPSFLLDGTFFSRFNEREQGLVVYVEEGLRDALLEARPETYFTTDHYRGYPYVLVRLGRLRQAELQALYEAAFRRRAKPRRIAEWEARRVPRRAQLSTSGSARRRVRATMRSKRAGARARRRTTQR